MVDARRIANWSNAEIVVTEVFTVSRNGEPVKPRKRTAPPCREYPEPTTPQSLFRCAGEKANRKTGGRPVSPAVRQIPRTSATTGWVDRQCPPASPALPNRRQQLGRLASSRIGLHSTARAEAALSPVVRVRGAFLSRLCLDHDAVFAVRRRQGVGRLRHVRARRLSARQRRALEVLPLVDRV